MKLNCKKCLKDLHDDCLNPKTCLCFEKNHDKPKISELEQQANNIINKITINELKKSAKQGSKIFQVTKKGKNFQLEILDHEIQTLRPITLLDDNSKFILVYLPTKTTERFDDELKNKFLDYKIAIHEFFSQPAIKGNPQALSIFSLFKKLTSFIDEICENEFMNSYRPITLKENFLPLQLGKIFMDYRIKELEEYYKNLETSDSSKNHAELKIQAQQKCKLPYAGSTPWEIINEFLNAYTTFRYTISFPEEFTADTYFYNTRTPFMPELIDSVQGISINYQTMSSGEQILFALALCLFKVKSDNIFPKLLLLDEVDATLHPSMIENLLYVIHEVLLKKGTKVIMATHSPTTIAIVPEKSIFIVNPDGQKRIEKRDKENALKILTEGYMTLQEGIKWLGKIGNKEILIISEGNNSKYLKKANEFFGDVTKIEILEGFEGASGNDQLVAIFDLFTVLPHNLKVIIVWDPECNNRRNKEAKNNTYAFVLPMNPNHKITKRGIENLFDESLFERSDYSETKHVDDVIGHTLYKNQKNNIMERIINNANKEKFQNFKPLFDFINQNLIK